MDQPTGIGAISEYRDQGTRLTPKAWRGLIAPLDTRPNDSRTCTKWKILHVPISVLGEIEPIRTRQVDDIE